MAGGDKMTSGNNVPPRCGKCRQYPLACSCQARVEGHVRSTFASVAEAINSLEFCLENLQDLQSMLGNEVPKMTYFDSPCLMKASSLCALMGLSQNCRKALESMRESNSLISSYSEELAGRKRRKSASDRGSSETSTSLEAISDRMWALEEEENSKRQRLSAEASMHHGGSEGEVDETVFSHS